MFSFICGLYMQGKYNNVTGLESHDKERAHTGVMGRAGKPKI
jgi:hypothetical protein